MNNTDKSQTLWSIHSGRNKYIVCPLGVYVQKKNKAKSG